MEKNGIKREDVLTNRQEIWLRAWCAAKSGGSMAPTEFADRCLKDFDERWKREVY